MGDTCEHGGYFPDGDECCGFCAGEEINALKKRIAGLKRVVSGADTYCACCGGMVTLNDPVAIAAHVTQCPTRPSHALAAEVAKLKAQLEAQRETQFEKVPPSMSFALSDRAAPRQRALFPSDNLSQQEPNEFVLAHSEESWGDRGHLGTKLFLLLPRELNDNDQRAISRYIDDLKKALEAETFRLDPKEVAWKAEWLKRVRECFAPFGPIYMEEIPNEYGSNNPHRVWLRVTTPAGHFKVGWRSHVIHLDWEKTALPAFDPAPADEVTKWEKGIHCYGYEKLAEYLKVLALPRTP